MSDQTNPPVQPEPMEGSTEWRNRQAELAKAPARTQRDNDRIRDENHRIAEEQRLYNERVAREKAQIPDAARTDGGDTPSADPSGQNGGMAPYPKVPAQEQARENAEKRVEKHYDKAMRDAAARKATAPKP